MKRQGAFVEAASRIVLATLGLGLILLQAVEQTPSHVLGIDLIHERFRTLVPIWLLLPVE